MSQPTVCKILSLFLSESSAISTSQSQARSKVSPDITINPSKGLHLPIMSTPLRLLGFITYLIQFVIVSSFPGTGSLSPRQSSCDSLVCPPSLDDFVGGAQNLWNDVLGVGAGVAGWVIDKSTGLLVPQSVEPESKTKPDNGNAPAADPMYQPGPLDTPQDQCTVTSDSNPSDGIGQVSRHV